MWAVQHSLSVSHRDSLEGEECKNMTYLHPHWRVLLISAVVFSSKPRMGPTSMHRKSLPACVHSLMTVQRDLHCTCVRNRHTYNISFLLVTEAWFTPVRHSCPPFIEVIKNMLRNCMEGLHGFSMKLTWQRERCLKIRGRKRVKKKMQ